MQGNGLSILLKDKLFVRVQINQFNAYISALFLIYNIIRVRITFPGSICLPIVRHIRLIHNM